MKRFFVLFVAFLLVFTLVCCDSAESAQTSDTFSESSESIEETTRAKDKIVLEEGCDTTDFCVINGRMINFVPVEELKRIEKPLAKLLANEWRMIGERSGGDNIYCPDPDSPSVPQSYSCALMDVTGDGVPELLLHPFGYFGSSGTASYKIYDVYSGEYLGMIDDGMGIPWCSYYNVKEDNYYIIGQYYLRGGWPYRHRTFVELAHDSDEGFYDCSFASSSHDIDMIHHEEMDSGDVEYWEEIYPNTDYYTRDDSDSIDDYFWTIYDFNQNFIRIPETELKQIDWDDVCDDDDDLGVRAEKMARALVTSCQRIILPDNVRLNILYRDIIRVTDDEDEIWEW